MTAGTKAIAVGILCGVLIPINLASAQGVPPGQLPRLSAEWWQWALSLPAPVNPLLDTTRENCVIGQRGAVWFLAGLPGTGMVTRSCSIPEGVSLFFPVLNFINVNTPNCGQGGASISAKDLQKIIQPAIDHIHSVSVTVDEKDVKKTLLRRVIPDPFEVALPADNFFGPDACGPGVPAPPGIYSPAVDGGDYVSLPPLNPGAHTITFHSESDSSFFGHISQDVTFNLTVVPVSLK